MKKSLNLLLVMVLLVSILSACGATPEPQTVVETVVVEKEVPITVEVEKEVPVEVTRIVEVPAEAAEAAQGEAAAGPVTLTVYNPTGSFQVSQSFSPRVSDLNGKTICELSNGSWESPRTFPLIRELLQNQFPTAKFITFEQFPDIPSGSDVEGLEDLVKAAGCEAAILGNAG